jgi:hypothetical protein
MPAKPITAPVAPPPNPTPCNEEVCTWAASYLDGANGSRPYCAWHGPFAHLCPVCGGSEIWIDLGDGTHCATCAPKPTLTAQISVVLTAIDGDPDLRTSGLATELHRVLERAQTAEQDIADAEKAWPATRERLATIQQRVLADAQATAHGARPRSAARRTDAERRQLRLREAAAAERDVRTRLNRAGAARDDAQRRAVLAVSEVAGLRDALAEIRAESADAARARWLGRILGRT